MLQSSSAKSFAMKKIGERAKEFREARGWNTSEMARAVGTSRQNIESLEATGDRKPRYLTALARVMGVSTDELLASTHQASSIPPSTNFGTPSATQTDPPLVIPQYAAGGGMGRGFNLTDNPPGHIKSWHVDHEWLRLNVPAHTGLRNLAIVTGFGPSMRPMFNPGDPLLVDTGVRHIDHEGVYFFRVGEEGFIKLIQRVPEFDGPGVILRVISKNPDFPPYDISPKNPHFEVLGKVLTIWRSEHF